MSTPLIEFFFQDPARFPHPYPAAQSPEPWLAGMAQPGNDPVASAMLAAAGAGFIVPLAYDCQFQADDRGNVSFRSDGRISTQDHFQYRGTWFEQMAIIKFPNPWVIRTSPGYCCLIVPAINRFEIPFEPLSGVVETDTYYQEVFFPTISYLNPGESFAIPRGTPLVQVIPVPREPWRSIFNDLTSASGASINSP